MFNQQFKQQGISPWPSPAAGCAELFCLQLLARMSSYFPPLQAVHIELASYRTMHEPAFTLMLPRWLPGVGCLIPPITSVQFHSRGAYHCEDFHKVC